MGGLIVLGTGPLRGSKGDGISSFPRRGPGRYPQYPRIRSVIRFSLGSYLVLPSPCPLVPPPTGGGTPAPPPTGGGTGPPPLRGEGTTLCDSSTPPTGGVLVPPPYGGGYSQRLQHPPTGGYWSPPPTGGGTRREPGPGGWPPGGVLCTPPLRGGGLRGGYRGGGLALSDQRGVLSILVAVLMQQLPLIARVGSSPSRTLRAWPSATPAPPPTGGVLVPPPPRGGDRGGCWTRGGVPGRRNVRVRTRPDETIVRSKRSSLPGQEEVRSRRPSYEP